MSSLRTFIDAISTGRTNITYVLHKVLSDPATKEKLGAEIATNGAFNHPISNSLRLALIQGGMTEAEVQHIEGWPTEDKERVRAQVAEAWAKGQSVYFSWELHPGEEPLTDIRHDEKSDVHVTFRSPRKGVRIKSKLNVGEIMVDV